MTKRQKSELHFISVKTMRYRTPKSKKHLPRTPKTLLFICLYARYILSLQGKQTKNLYK